MANCYLIVMSFSALEEKRKKEELVKKRIELKHDKKARAMAKRTKDNFYGYDGIPLEEKSKRKQVIEGATGHRADQERLDEEEAEPSEYCQTESEHDESEEYEEQEPPLKAVTKPKAPLKSAPPPMNFTDLLRLAEKKQYEPVEIKVVKKVEERPRTAEELREREFLERKHKNIDRGKEKKMLEREKRLAPPTVSKKISSPKESVSARHKGPGDKHSSSRGNHLPQIGAEKKSRPLATSEKPMRLPSTKSQPGERTKAESGDGFQHSPSESHHLLLNGAGKSRSSSHSMGTGISKTVVRVTQNSNEHRPPKSPSTHPSHSKSGATSTPHDKTRNSGAKQPGNNSSSSTSARPGIGTSRPTLSPSPRRHGGSSSSGSEQQTNGSKRLISASGLPDRPVSGSSGRGHPTSNLGSSGRQVSSTSSTGRTVTQLGRPVSGSSGPGRPSSGGPGRPASGSAGPGRPVSGPGQPTSSSAGPERPVSGPGRPVSGPGRPVSGPGRPVSGPGRPVSGPGRPVSGPGRPVSGPGRPVSGPGRPVSGPGRPVSGPGRPVSGPGRPASGPGRPASGPGRPASGSAGPGRPVSGPGRPISSSGGTGRPISSSGGTGRPVSVSAGPGRTVSGSGPPVKPRCTVVSETISSKNIISRPSNGMMNGMRSPPPGYRPAVYTQGTQRSPFPPMARKRYLEEDEDEEYDSEMEDFIDDEGEPQEEISKHIREIFGYDRNKYKDESDYALRYMESSWREQQKEEAKSLRLGMQEDLEEMRREEEELKRRKAKKMKLR
ncbi:protein SPT2 homolog isoform X2 [Dromiciops gliroides]|uniref:protein SPT2 homolog isoform X2 n=1 Tax=Dromiciops gliroides TaxID=33562 RepID=UPI001CC6381F|nr:protein SPT2 homolog isoform X2 [Dromiciops gliroides]